MRLNKVVGTTTVGLGLFALLTAMLGVTAHAGTWVNPLRGSLGVHDPVMIKEGSTYHIFATGRLVGHKTSTDRITWSDVASGLSVPAWVRTEVPENNGTDFWAPDIIFRNNRYWLYYSVSSFGKNTSAIGLATSPTLANPVWTDQGVAMKSMSGNNYNCIDPCVFLDTDGKLYIAFGSFWSGLKLVECDIATGKPSGAAPNLIALAARTGGIEAPHLLKWGSYYYLFVSWDNCCDGCNSTYKIVAGRSTSVRGPYTDKAGRAMTSGGGEILDTGDQVRRGPGHNGIFIERDTVFCVNHYYACNPLLQIRTLYFDDGWPSFTGTKTSPFGVDVKQPVVAARRRASPTRMVLDGSRHATARGSRVFTISGREIVTTPGSSPHRIPRGVCIIVLSD